MVALLVLVTILGFLTLDYFVQRRAAERAALPHAARESPAPVAGRLVDLARVPAGVFVGPGHAWLALEPAGTVRVGADRFPLMLLGGVDRLDVLPPGSRARRGKPLAVLHRGDRAIPLPAPVDGVVTELGAGGAALGEDAFGGGWLCRLAPRGLASALREMRVAEDAVEWTRRELVRLRDFLVGTGRLEGVAAATLADGGLPVDGVAARLDARCWDELVARFFRNAPSADGAGPQGA